MRPEETLRQDERAGGGAEANLCKVPVFRPVAAKLLRVLNDGDTCILEVSELLKSDPGLSAEVLTMANSAAFGSSRRIHTVARAIVMLGTERTKGLATRAALQGMMRNIHNPAIENCWIHSRAAAVIGEWLAPYYRIHPDRAYTSSLMHDIGRLGLLSVDRGQYARLLTSTSGTNEDILEAERLLLKVNHCDAGLWLTKTWGLPEEFWHVSSRHHIPKESTGDAHIELVRLACAFAQALGYKAAPLVANETLEELMSEIPNLASPQSGRAIHTLSDRLQEELGLSPQIPLVEDLPVN